MSPQGRRPAQSGLGHLNQMVNALNHAHDRGVILLDNGVVHFSEAEGIERTLLYGGRADAAFYLFDFYLCHF